jgi:hypothetical protein
MCPLLRSYRFSHGKSSTWRKRPLNIFRKQSKTLKSTASSTSAPHPRKASSNAWKTAQPPLSPYRSCSGTPKKPTRPYKKFSIPVPTQQNWPRRKGSLVTVSVALRWASLATKKTNNTSQRSRMARARECYLTRITPRSAVSPCPPSPQFLRPNRIPSLCTAFFPF